MAESAVPRLSQFVQLRSTRFTRLIAISDFPSEQPLGRTGKLVPVAGYEARAVEAKIPDTVVVEVTGHFGVVEDPRKKPLEPGAEVHLTLELIYSLPGGTKTTEDELQAFAKLNGVFNAWPYFRAELFGLYPRMGLPPYTLPTHRAKPKVAPPSEVRRKDKKARRA